MLCNCCAANQGLLESSFYADVFINQGMGWGYVVEGVIHGQVVKAVDFKTLASHCCGFESSQGLWIHSCEEAIQLAYISYPSTLLPEKMDGDWRGT